MSKQELTEIEEGFENLSPLLLGSIVEQHNDNERLHKVSIKSLPYRMNAYDRRSIWAASGQNH